MKATTMQHLSSELSQLFRRFEQENDGKALVEAVEALSVAAPSLKSTKPEALVFYGIKLRAMLTLFNYIDSKMISNFDFKTEPELSVPPPPESGLPSGVAPESIKDPKVRAEYQRALETNRARTAQYYLQSDLRDADVECTAMFKREISLHFQRYNRVELSNLLEETIRSSRRQASLKALVAAHSNHAP